MAGWHGWHALIRAGRGVSGLFELPFHRVPDLLKEIAKSCREIARPRKAPPDVQHIACITASRLPRLCRSKIANPKSKILRPRLSPILPTTVEGNLHDLETPGTPNLNGEAHPRARANAPAASRAAEAYPLRFE